MCRLDVGDYAFLGHLRQSAWQEQKEAEAREECELWDVDRAAGDVAGHRLGTGMPWTCPPPYCVAAWGAGFSGAGQWLRRAE